MDNRQDTSAHAVTLAPRRGVVTGLVYLFEQVMPDPFVLSICLTLFVILLSLGLAPNATLPVILTAWYGGTFNILGFALQMILILATGYAIADAPLIQSGLRAMAAGVQTPTKAALVVFPIVAIASWLNWGLGLVVGALLAREIAKRVKVDFAWLVAGSYSAWSVCNSGLSSSIALSQASHGNALNLVEKATGQVIPLSQTVFAPFVFVPTLLVVIVMTAIFIKMHPKPDQVVVFRDTSTEEVADPHARDAKAASLASRVERSILGTLLLLVLGAGYLVMSWHDKGFELDINTTILIFLLVGLALQRTPIAYADAIRRAARQTGSMLLQYPRDNGHHERDRFGISDRQSLRGDCNAGHARGMELSQFADHYAADPQRRRTLGRTGAVRPSGCAQLARTRCPYRYGRGDGRKRVEHAAAFLGRSRRGDCGHSHSARDGLYRDHVRRLAHHLRRRALANPLSRKKLPEADGAAPGDRRL